MGKNHILSSIAACLGMGLLILDSRTALWGAGEGVALAISVLVPSLFPFLFLSIWLTDSFAGSTVRALMPLGRVFRMPPGTRMLLIPAFLGGYPAGAQAVGQAHRAGHISRETAQKLLVFCSNAGPSFLFGMTAAFFPERWMVWALWGFHILGAWIAARLVSWNTSERREITSTGTSSPVPALKKAVSVMAVICGWVILFRILIAFLDRWILWLAPEAVRTAVVGLLELSNGICTLGAVNNIALRFLLCSGMLSLGGLCVILQTLSVTPGLNLKGYFFGKLVQTVVSISCGMAVFYSPFFLIVPGILLVPGFSQKTSGNPAAIGV